MWTEEGPSYRQVHPGEPGFQSALPVEFGRAMGNESRAVEVPGIRAVRRAACLASSREARSEHRDFDGGGVLVSARTFGKARLSGRASREVPPLALIARGAQAT